MNVRRIFFSKGNETGSFGIISLLAKNIFRQTKGKLSFEMSLYQKPEMLP
jgi:hypothetical protein